MPSLNAWMPTCFDLLDIGLTQWTLKPYFTTKTL